VQFRQSTGYNSKNFIAIDFFTEHYYNLLVIKSTPDRIQDMINQILEQLYP
jgi:hypothetical protein